MMKVLLVAAPRELVTQQLEVLKNNRIKPRVVDIISNAQMRAFETYLSPVSAEEENGNPMDVILSMGASTTEITIIEGDRLKFTRTILKGGNDISRAIEKKFELPFNEAEILKRRVGLSLTPEKESTGEKEAPAEKAEEDKSVPNQKEVEKLIVHGVHDIFNEIRKSLNYYKTQYQKVTYRRIILSGGMAAMPNIGQALKEQFGITIVMANPLKGIAINQADVNMEHLEKYKRALSTAIGLAKRER